MYIFYEDYVGIQYVNLHYDFIRVYYHVWL